MQICVDKTTCRHVLGWLTTWKYTQNICKLLLMNIIILSILICCTEVYYFSSYMVWLGCFQTMLTANRVVQRGVDNLDHYDIKTILKKHMYYALHINQLT